MKNKKAFTLVELLAVLVIFGIILGIVVPSVIQLFENQKVKKYDYHEGAVKNAIEAYVDEIKETLQDSTGECSCYKIMYDDLLATDLVKEDDITCNSNNNGGVSGYILAYPIGNSNLNFKYEYYLTCKDQSNNEMIHEATVPENTCCGVNRDFRISSYVVKYNDASGEDYKGDWTSGNVYQRFEATSPYMVPITSYQYSLDGGNTWTTVGENDFTFTNHIDSTVQVRAVDADGNKSGSIAYKVRIDKIAPTAEFDIQGTLGEDDWYTTSLTISPKNASDLGSGIESVEVDVTSITSPTYGTPITLTIKDKVGHVTTYTKTVKVDNIPPKITFGINGYNTGTASCEVSISGLVSAPPETMYLSNGSNRIFTASCKNGAGVTTTISHEYGYSICREGENTCQYGCDEKYNPCHSQHWDANINCYQACNTGCTCKRQVPNCFSTGVQTCLQVHGGTMSGGKCCLGTKTETYTCDNCSCGTHTACNGGNVCDPGYDKVNCSSCYTGHNTCIGGFCFNKNDSQCMRSR